MLRIVTDGAGGILPSWGKEYGIDIIPVNILFGEKSYLQGVELDNEGFYRRVVENRKIPKTSQPSPHQFVEFYPSDIPEAPSYRDEGPSAGLSFTVLHMNAYFSAIPIPIRPATL